MNTARTMQAHPLFHRIVAGMGAMALITGGAVLGIEDDADASSVVLNADGQPAQSGIPVDPTTVFLEDFSATHADGTTAVVTANASSSTVPGTSPIPLNNFRHNSSTVAYSAAPQWLPSAPTSACNGWILNYNSTNPSAIDAACGSGGGIAGGSDLNGTGATAPTASWAFLRYMANAIGLAEGMSTAAAQQNNVVAAMTNSGSPQAAGEQIIMTGLPTVSGHYYTTAVVVGATHCSGDVANKTWFDPEENLWMIVDGQSTLVGSALDPCVMPNVPGTYNTLMSGATGWTNGVYDMQDALFPQISKKNQYGGKVHISDLMGTSAVQVPSTGTNHMGFAMQNLQTQSSGNDVAFDNPQILDVTPRIDKTFSPSVIHPGGTSTLTFVITNTSDLLAKPGWTFTDTLPSGTNTTTGAVAASLQVATNQVTSTCSNTTASASGTTITVTGDLNVGQSYCTVSVPVTANDTNILDVNQQVVYNNAINTDVLANGNCGAACGLVGAPAATLTEQSWPPPEAELKVHVTEPTLTSSDGNTYLTWTLEALNAGQPGDAGAENVIMTGTHELPGQATSGLENVIFGDLIIYDPQGNVVVDIAPDGTVVQDNTQYYPENEAPAGLVDSLADLPLGADCTTVNTSGDPVICGSHSITPIGDGNAEGGEWDIGNLPAGYEAKVIITTQVTDPTDYTSELSTTIAIGGDSVYKDTLNDGIVVSTPIPLPNVNTYPGLANVDVNSDTDQWDQALFQMANPHMAITKVADASAITDPNQVVTFDVTVSNTGNTILTDVAVADAVDGMDLTCPDDITLYPANDPQYPLPDYPSTAHCTVTYDVSASPYRTIAALTAATLQAGGTSVTNVASITATPQVDDGTGAIVTLDVTPTCDSLVSHRNVCYAYASVPIEYAPNPKLQVDVTSPDVTASANNSTEVLTWTVTAQNAGNSTADDVVMTSTLGDGLGAITAVTASDGTPLTYTPVCVDASGNTVYVNGSGVVVTADPTTDALPDDAAPMPDSPTGTCAAAGYSTGLDLGSMDTLASDGVPLVFTVSAEVASTYDPTDLTALTNTVSITGDYTVAGSPSTTYAMPVPDSNNINSNGVNTDDDQWDQASFTLPTASITMTKQVNQVNGSPAVTGTTVTSAGTPVTYSFVVTNTGTTWLVNIDINDPMLVDPTTGESTVVCPQARLAAGAHMVCTGTYTVTDQDMTGNSDHDANGGPTGTVLHNKASVASNFAYPNPDTTTWSGAVDPVSDTANVPLVPVAPPTYPANPFAMPATGGPGTSAVHVPWLALVGVASLVAAGGVVVVTRRETLAGSR
ncbi:MAG: hypothetical protein LBH13_00010 [Cellulomonadaceae bacterium]|jgi:uncharacterized repeat protein (TIGR01451 family)|nr:hypothetical protein [Cellulomonadaceae bacterium]